MLASLAERWKLLTFSSEAWCNSLSTSLFVEMKWLGSIHIKPHHTLRAFETFHPTHWSSPREANGSNSERDCCRPVCNLRNLGLSSMADWKRKIARAWITSIEVDLNRWAVMLHKLGKTKWIGHTTGRAYHLEINSKNLQMTSAKQATLNICNVM